MSNIYIAEYDGDPEEFDPNESPNPGGVVTRHRYTDGEELMAATKILELLDESTHFDVRCEVY